MFTVTKRLLFTLPVSLPTCCQCHSANPIHPRHSPAQPARGLGRGRSSLISTFSLTPKPERARQRQLLQMCLPHPAHVGGQGWDWGLIPSFQLCSLSLVVRGL